MKMECPTCRTHLPSIDIFEDFGSDDDIELENAVNDINNI